MANPTEPRYTVDTSDERLRIIIWEHAADGGVRFLGHRDVPRIVACLNACDGMNDLTLMTMAQLQASFAAKGAELARLQAAVDLLRSALQNCALYPEKVDEIAGVAMAKTEHLELDTDHGGSEYPECSGDPSSCPENEGYGCCGKNESEVVS